MEVRSSSKPPLEHAQQLLRLLLTFKTLREEIYLQVIKQTFENKSRVSVVKAWQLLTLLLSVSCPVPAFGHYLSGPFAMNCMHE
jgi:hypothetical protein